MTEFTWLHVGDVHFGHGGAAYGHDQQLIANALVDDATSLVDQGTVPAPNAIIVTGDIANTGGARSPDEYDLAGEWLSRLAESLRVPTKSIYCVPGNHDVNRGAANSNRLLRRLLQASRGGVEVDEALDDPADRKALAKQFEGYRQFAATYTAAECMGDDGTALHWRTERPLGDCFTLRMVGLNTALLSADDSDHGKLQVGKRQLQEAFVPAPGKDTITIVLSHHPLDWLSDAAEALGWVQRHGDLHLTGHLHEQGSTTSRRGGGRELIVIASGAVHGDETELRSHAYNFGRVTVDGDGRADLRMWPRRWSEKAAGFILDVENIDEGEGDSASYQLRKSLIPRQPGPPSALRASAEASVELFGSRSSAFPHDLTISELAAMGLIVPPRAIWQDTLLSVGDITALVRDRRSVLLLGEPGAGKTVLSYGVCDGLLADGNRLPLVISIPKLAASSVTPATIAAAVVAPNDGNVSASDVTSGHVVLVADGIDEALAAGMPVRDVAAVLVSLPSIAPTLVACRRFEFEHQLAAHVETAMYETAILAEWTVEAEFSDFVRRLVGAGRLQDESVVEAVAGSPGMRQLVTRPLYARMLTAVLSEAHSEDVGGEAALYASYLHHLARTVEARLVRTGCDSQHVYGLWRVMAWRSFVARLFSGDSLPGSAPVELLVNDSVTPECAQTIAAGLFDFTTGAGDLRAKYRHYSFFEFLVADHVAASLVKRIIDGEEHCDDLLRHDLPQEMRRHLVAIVRRDAPDAVVRLLTTQFSRLREDINNDADRLVVGNLAAYVLGRAGTPAARLRSLLEAEREPFLQTSLLWALANAGDEETTEGYLETLATDDLMAALNRGYLLYYYGDLERSLPPPYLDDDPAREWRSTRPRVTALLSEAGYEERRPITRQALDAWTLADMLAFHGAEPTDTEARLLESAIERFAVSHEGLARHLATARERAGPA